MNVKKIVAYCRVSTNKEEKLDSLESQQKFFWEYFKWNGHSLIKIYAGKGKSRIKMKDWTEFFSKLIKCTCCRASSRRRVHSYKNICIKWMCSGRNYNGTDSCPNETLNRWARTPIWDKKLFYLNFKGQA